MSILFKIYDRLKNYFYGLDGSDIDEISSSKSDVAENSGDELEVQHSDLIDDMPKSIIDEYEIQLYGLGDGNDFYTEDDIFDLLGPAIAGKEVSHDIIRLNMTSVFDYKSSVLIDTKCTKNDAILAKAYLHIANVFKHGIYQYADAYEHSSPSKAKFFYVTNTEDLKGVVSVLEEAYEHNFNAYESILSKFSTDRSKVDLFNKNLCGMYSSQHPDRDEVCEIVILNSPENYPALDVACCLIQGLYKDDFILSNKLTYI